MAILLNHLWKWDRLQYTNERLRVQVALVILISMTTATRPAALLEPVYAKQGHGELPKVLRYEHVRLLSPRFRTDETKVGSGNQPCLSQRIRAKSQT
ncbi:hypothetical protein EJ06DRAFT_534872, partial [Trichodelitschia bisporula]